MKLTQKEQEAIKSLMVDMVAVVPPLNVAMGIKDITTVGWDLYQKNYKNKNEENSLKIQLILGVICLIPGAGAPIRASLKQLVRNPDVYAPIMFEIVTLIIEKTNVELKKIGFAPIPINPEKLLNQLIDTNRLKAYLEQGRQAALKSARGSVFNRWFNLPQAINQCFDFLRDNLASCIYLLQPYIEKSIRLGRQRTNNVGSRRVDTSNQQNTSTKTPNSTKKDQPTKGVSTGTATNKPKAAIPKLSNSFIGGVGEHLADYYCLEKLGWGKGNWVRHDAHNKGGWKNTSGPRKLNDGGKLKKLQSIGNDQGIDGFWKANPATNGGKPYAIVEAKGSTSVLGNNSDIAARLGVLKEKNTSGQHVVQMDHHWIQGRLAKLLASRAMDVSVRADFRIQKKDWKLKYRRHIVFTALHIPNTDGFQHAQALLTQQDEGHHQNHQPTRHLNKETEINTVITAARNGAKAKEKRHKPPGKK